MIAKDAIAGKANRSAALRGMVRKSAMGASAAAWDMMNIMDDHRGIWIPVTIIPLGVSLLGKAVSYGTNAGTALHNASNFAYGIGMAAAIGSLVALPAIRFCAERISSSEWFNRLGA